MRVVFAYRSYDGQARSFDAWECPDVEAARQALEDMLDTPVAARVLR